MKLIKLSCCESLTMIINGMEINYVVLNICGILLGYRRPQCGEKEIYTVDLFGNIVHKKDILAEWDFHRIVHNLQVDAVIKFMVPWYHVCAMKFFREHIEKRV